ncbi:hypothetical protein AAG747_21665 [Rapidithrix thailandica]|uniref:Ig-like domain-containing protein n=1 Tax=Rapidithrix thailandica TaxID=413964 RepID=A0AAW9SDJ3_9BACT
MMNVKIFLIPVLLWVLSGVPSWGQSPDSLQYYLPIQRADSYKVYEAKDSTLYFSFTEHTVKQGELDCRLQDKFQRELASVTLAKEYGQNNYALRLFASGYTGWQEGERYRLVVSDEQGREHALYFKCVKGAVEKPSPNIRMNAVSVDCDRAEGNLVEFLGTVEQGQAPYRVEWLVSTDREGEALLYEPLEATVQRGGEVPRIQLDKAGGYYVTLKVWDLCGQYGEQVAKVDCKANDSDTSVELEWFEQPKKVQPGTPIK